MGKRPYCEAYLKDERPCPHGVQWAHYPSGSYYCGYHKPAERYNDQGIAVEYARPVTKGGRPR